VQFIGEELNMNNEKEQDIEIDIKQLYKVVDKLEKRIASLEKVLSSHAKCIGEMREEEIGLNQEYRKKIVKRMGELHE
jgi:exonuclease VII small subunit